jgi:cytosine deaminase
VAFDWLLRGGRLPGHDGVWDVGLEGHRVAAVAPRLDTKASRELALDGRLVVPGFTNAYLRLPRSADLEGQALLALETALRHGTTAAHVSVDTDPDEPLMPLRLLARVRAQLGDRLAVTLALRLDVPASPELRGLAVLLDGAKRAGADALEIAVPPSSDGRVLAALLERLGQTGLALDLEVDAMLPSAQIAASALALPRVLDVLEQLPTPPPVRLLHGTALAAVHRQELAPWLTRLRARGIALVLCPLETLRLTGRSDAVAARRGIPRLRELLTAGVPVHLGSGAASEAAALDPLDELWLAAYAGHLGTPAALEQLRPLIAPGAIEAGAPADLVVLEAPTFARAVVDHADKAFVFRAGSLVHRAARVSEPVRVQTPERLVIRQATLPRRGGRYDIAMQDGVIREIASRIDGAAGAEIMADGRLVVPAFVDAHLHVDKTFVMDGLALGPSNLTLPEAVAAMGRAKAAYTPDDLVRRGRLTLGRALRHGTTAIRAQCDVDPIIGLMALEALVALRREFADRLDLQIVAFPQEGLVGNPEALDLMRRALAAGADAVGGGPLDGDYQLHIAQVFALAQEAGVPVDIHADLAIDHLRPLPEWEAPLVAAHARQAGLVGRVAIGHFASSSALTTEEVSVLATLLAEAGVSVAALPASEMYRQGLADPVNSRRGVPRVGDLLEAGVNVVFASNNIRDAFVTFGNADMLEQARLGAIAAFLDDMDTVLELVTSRPARLMGLTARDAVAVGKHADLVVLDARTAAEAVGDQVEKLEVIRRGRVVVHNRVELGAA